MKTVDTNWTAAQLAVSEYDGTCETLTRGGGHLVTCLGVAHTATARLSRQVQRAMDTEDPR